MSVNMGKDCSRYPLGTYRGSNGPGDVRYVGSAAGW